MHNNSSAASETELGREVESASAKHPYLVGLGDRVRAARHRMGISRKSLAVTAKVSERHLANLEYGTGNASILVLQDVAKALRSSVSELIGEGGLSATSADALLIQEALAQLDEAKLKQVLQWLRDNYSSSDPTKRRESRIALVGLRGAGKSTLGRMIASDLGFKFVELSREIEKLAGGTIGEVQAMYGVGAYRRYEKRAMQTSKRS
jgi:XRE family transcriptional regulator, aerobic/anaerobic benzoate catabolism transcriptional regulator